MKLGGCDLHWVPNEVHVVWRSSKFIAATILDFGKFFQVGRIGRKLGGCHLHSPMGPNKLSFERFVPLLRSLVADWNSLVPGIYCSVCVANAFLVI